MSPDRYNFLMLFLNKLRLSSMKIKIAQNGHLKNVISLLKYCVKSSHKVNAR